MHHGLWPPRALTGKEGILSLIQHLACIQYDPVNVVGRNPDLVLQSRILDYRPQFLDQLLYQDRVLIDGWDKLASIYLSQDWPYFTRHRTALRKHYLEHAQTTLAIAPLVRQEISRRGPLCSLDFDHHDTIDWWWGQPTRQVRAVLEILFATGELGINHRVNTRRYFNLVERLLSTELLSLPDPNPDELDYQDWHVLRRVGSLGLANPRASEHWLGIFQVKAPQRRAALDRLLSRGDLALAQVDDGTSPRLYLRAVDLPRMEQALSETFAQPQAAFIAPLDNLLWDRGLIRWLFDFDYTWEVYKPAHQRKYAHYVLPVLYGERFVARMEAIFERKTLTLILRNWWWEENLQPGEEMMSALADCLHLFADYLGALSIQAEPSLLREIKTLV